MIDLEIVCDDEKYLPKYGNETDARMDLKIKIENKQGTYILAPKKGKVFSTGVKVKVPVGYEMNIVPRSSTGIKNQCMMMNTVGVIDAGYRDEVKLAIYNYGDYSVELVDGQRVCQFKLELAEKINLKLVKDDENFKSGNRGGGIGSTGE